MYNVLQSTKDWFYQLSQVNQEEKKSILTSEFAFKSANLDQSGDNLVQYNYRSDLVEIMNENSTKNSNFTFEDQEQANEDYDTTVNWLADSETAETEEYSFEKAIQPKDVSIKYNWTDDHPPTEFTEQSNLQESTSENSTGFKNFAVQYSNVNFAEVSASNYDLLIIEGSPGNPGAANLTDAQVAALTAQGRTVAGYVSVGQTDDVRPYWDRSWTSDGTDTGTPTANAPSWLAEKADSFDASIVKFWDPEWQKIVIDQVVDLANRGYNGIFMDNILSYYELADIRGELGTARGQFYAQEMMSFVAKIAKAGRAINPDFKVIPNGGPYIINDAGYSVDSPEAKAYFDAIDAIMSESIFGLINGVRSDPALDLFQKAFGDRGIDVLALEYSKDPDAIEKFAKEALERGFIPSVSPDQNLSVLPKPIVPDPTDNTAPIYLEGTSGDDVLVGNGGADMLVGLAGNDLLRGGSGGDLIKGGEGADKLFGEGDDDGLFGGSGDDYISAGAGNDEIDGGAGNDKLFGGEGYDVFSFSGNFGNDTIEDFNIEMDLLKLDKNASWKASASKNGVLLKFNDGSSIELVGVDISNVDDLMFI